MELSDRQAPGGADPAPGLLILTGASHTGKTTVAQSVLDVAGPPAALLSVDDVLANTISRPPESIWAEIPLAYDLLSSQLETLLDRGWFVVLESTFTYVPEEGAPEFHADAMQRLIGVAEQHGTPWLLAQLSAGDDIVRSRADRTGRISPEIVAQTVELHIEAKMPASVLRLDATEATPDQLARQIVAALRDGSTPA